MKSIQIQKFGGPEVFEIKDIEIGNLYLSYKLPIYNNAILSGKNVVNKYWMDSTNPLFKK